MVTQSTAFEAWKNFILILAGVLAGDMFSSLGMGQGFIHSVQSGIEQFLLFDKWYAHVLHAYHIVDLLTVLIVVYFIKCYHGIFVGIFSDGYYDELARSPRRAFVLTSCATITIVSLSFAQWFASAVEHQHSLSMRGAALLGTVCIPTAALMLFDVSRFKPHRFFHYVRRFSAEKKSFDEVVGTWIVEDVALLLVATVGLALAFWQVGNVDFQIDLILGVLIFILVVHSLLDYWANRSFFFGYTSSETNARRSRALNGRLVLSWAVARRKKKL